MSAARSALCLVVSAAFFAGVLLPAVEACGKRPCCGGCTTQAATQDCPGVSCADRYAGMDRRDASPLRITTAPLRTSLAQRAAAPTGLSESAAGFLSCSWSPPRSPSAFSKRYLLTRTLRL